MHREPKRRAYGPKSKRLGQILPRNLGPAYGGFRPGREIFRPKAHLYGSGEGDLCVFIRLGRLCEVIVPHRAGAGQAVASLAATGVAQSIDLMDFDRPALDMTVRTQAELQ